MSDNISSLHVAIDLGASGGRVALGWLPTHGKLEVEILHRFPNGAVPIRGALHWDIVGLWRVIDDDTRRPISLIALESDHGVVSGRVMRVMHSDHGTHQQCPVSITHLALDRGLEPVDQLLHRRCGGIGCDDEEFTVAQVRDGIRGAAELLEQLAEAH